MPVPSTTNWLSICCTSGSRAKRFASSTELPGAGPCPAGWRRCCSSRRRCPHRRAFPWPARSASSGRTGPASGRMVAGCGPTWTPCRRRPGGKRPLARCRGLAPLGPCLPRHLFRELAKRRRPGLPGIPDGCNPAQEFGAKQRHSQPAAQQARRQMLAGGRPDRSAARAWRTQRSRPIAQRRESSRSIRFESRRRTCRWAARTTAPAYGCQTYRRLHCLGTKSGPPRSADCKGSTRRLPAMPVRKSCQLSFHSISCDTLSPHDVASRDKNPHKYTTRFIPEIHNHPRYPPSKTGTITATDPARPLNCRVFFGSSNTWLNNLSYLPPWPSRPVPATIALSVRTDAGPARTSSAKVAGTILVALFPSGATKVTPATRRLLFSLFLKFLVFGSQHGWAFHGISTDSVRSDHVAGRRTRRTAHRPVRRQRRRMGNWAGWQRPSRSVKARGFSCWRPSGSRARCRRHFPTGGISPPAT